MGRRWILGRLLLWGTTAGLAQEEEAFSPYTSPEDVAAGGLVFGGSVEGYFFALDDATGKELWRRNLGGKIISAPTTYLSRGQQLVSVAAGNTLFTFGLRQP